MTEFEVAVLTELRRIRALLEARDAGDTNLLRAIHSATRGALFTARELCAHAAIPANRDLQAALERKFDDPNSRRIGKFLASIAGREVAGFTVNAVGEERDGCIWRVQVTTGKPALPVVREDKVAHADSFTEGVRKCG